MSALTNGFRILQSVIGAGGDGLGFAQIVEDTGVPRASAHRLLKVLQSLSAVSFDPNSRRYIGGVLLARLGAEVLSNYDLRRAVRPHLAALHERTGFVATLGMRNDDVGIYLDKIEGTDFGIRLHSEIGKAFPLHCTAMGKVLLAHADKDLKRRLTRRKLEAYTSNTITTGDDLKKELEEIVEAGYALDREEITRGLMCVAAPVFGASGSVAGAMSCTFPSYVADESGIRNVANAVISCATAASGDSVQQETRGQVTGSTTRS